MFWYCFYASVIRRVVFRVRFELFFYFGVFYVVIEFVIVCNCFVYVIVVKYYEYGLFYDVEM